MPNSSNLQVRYYIHQFFLDIRETRQQIAESMKLHIEYLDKYFQSADMVDQISDKTLYYETSRVPVTLKSYAKFNPKYVPYKNIHPLIINHVGKTYFLTIILIYSIFIFDYSSFGIYTNLLICIFIKII